MREEDDQIQPEMTDVEAATVLPWDAIKPPEDEDDAPLAAQPLGDEAGEAVEPSLHRDAPTDEAQSSPADQELPHPTPAEPDPQATQHTEQNIAPAEADPPASPVPQTATPSGNIPRQTICLPVLHQSAAPSQDDSDLRDGDDLPWASAEAADEASIGAGETAAEDPQPPALAFAPAFLAIDEAGLPVPDEVVDQLPEKVPSLAPVTLEPEELGRDAADTVVPAGGGIWTIPLICLGIAVVACCVLIPQSDKNRKLAWEREALRRDLEQIQTQVEINDTFLTALAEDLFLAKRLAQRQLNVVPAGTAVLEVDALSRSDASPFQLVMVPPPDPLPPYVPIGGRFAEMCRTPRTQLYLIGCGLLAIATGLVLGRDPITSPPASASDGLPAET